MSLVVGLVSLVSVGRHRPRAWRVLRSDVDGIGRTVSDARAFDRAWYGLQHGRMVFGGFAPFGAAAGLLAAVFLKERARDADLDGDTVKTTPARRDTFR
jgi:hypothetical protein